MNYRNVLFISAIAAVIALSGAAPPAWAQTPPLLPIAQQPLFLQGRVKPAFVMAVDDSGSMAWEALFANQNGTAYWGQDPVTFAYGFYRTDGTLHNTGVSDYLELFPFPGRSTKRKSFPAIPNFGFARSHEFNPASFNPNVAYPPWLKADNTTWPNATPTSVLVDARNAGSQSFDLTQNVRVDGTAWRTEFQNGMIVPPLTSYYKRAGGCNFGGSLLNNVWTTSLTATTLTGACTASLEYFPATFYLTDPTFPGYIGVPLPVLPGGGGPNVPLFRYEIKPANFASGAAYNNMMQSFANWFQYYRDRNIAMVAALTRAFGDVDFMRVGYFTINNRTNPVDMLDLAIPAERAALYANMTSLTASGGTPNRTAVANIGQQFKRSPAVDPDAPVQLSCQVNAGMLFTDGYSNGGGPTGFGNADGGMGVPFADSFSNTMADIAAEYYLNTLVPAPAIEQGRMPVPAACSDPSPDPRLDCQVNPHMNFYGITLGALGAVYQVNIPSTTNPYANPPAWQPRQDDTPPAVDEIWHAALNTRGKFINARTPQSVSDAVKEILRNVLNATVGSGALSLTGARASSESLSFVPSFTVNERDWTGEMRAVEITTAGTTGATIWNASTGIPAPAARNIFITTQSGTSTTAAPFTTGALGGSLIAQLLAIGLTPGTLLLRHPGYTVNDLVDYLRGVKTLEQDQTPAGQSRDGRFRSRSSLLGDIVNSVPAVAGPKDDYGFSALGGALGTSYRGYLTTKRARSPAVFIGANDGMLHAFDGRKVGGGGELFAFIPKSVRGKLAELANPEYAHQYYVDGESNIGDAFLGSWKTILVGSPGAGGRGVFALDIGNPGAFTASDVMWEQTGADDGDIGQSIGKAQIVLAEDNNWYAIFGNGYNSVNGNPVLMIVNLASGAITRKIVADDGGTFSNGLSPILALDKNFNGKVDTVYGGDLRGNLWKFDLSTGPTGGSVAFGGQPLYVARDAAPTPQRQPITSGLEVAAGPDGGDIIYFGTGRYLLEGDNATPPDPPIQTFYGVLDNNSTAITGGRAVLKQQTINGQTVTGSLTARTTTTGAADFTIQRGFYIDLAVDSGSGPDAKGERFVGTPRVQSGDVFFTTFQPSGDICKPGGDNFIYGLNAITGASALGAIRVGGPAGTSVCGGNCGGVSIASGAPVKETVIIVPQPQCVLGVDPGCTPPVRPLPGEPPPPDFSALYTPCSIVITAAGAPNFFLPRACGRQSWRQIR